jgi:hypothetical protein
MAKSLITQTLGGPSHGVLGLIEISDKIARLSEAGYAFETKRLRVVSTNRIGVFVPMEITP